MSLFYCPNCKKSETGKIAYNEKDIIMNFARDGYGLGLHYVICKECGYPLSAFVNTNKIDNDTVEYYNSVINAYQNGEYETKENMLMRLRQLHQKGYDVILVCNKF